MAFQSSTPSKPICELIDDYYSQKTVFSSLIATHPNKIAEPESAPNTPNKPIMPVHAAEENATGSITDQVAKDSSDSTASTHKNHNVDTGVNPGGVHANAHKANPGPVIAENIGKPESKEALKKRAEELNQ